MEKSNLIGEMLAKGLKKRKLKMSILIEVNTNIMAESLAETLEKWNEI